jgi:hypothetical protein
LEPFYDRVPSTTPDGQRRIDLPYQKKSDRTTLRHSGKVKKSVRGISAQLQTSIGWVSQKVLVKVHFGVKVFS